MASEEGPKLELCSTTAESFKEDSLITVDEQNIFLHSKVADILVALENCESICDELLKLECYSDLVGFFFVTE